MSTKRKLVCLTAEQKKEICIYHGNNSSKKHQEIADFFSARLGQAVSRQSVGDILADKQKWLDYSLSSSSKKLRAGKHTEMEAALQLWFASARSQNIVVTDAVLREKAKQFGTELSIEDFHYSNGWLHRFKTRCGITGQVICGESARVDPEVISQGRERAMNLIKDYALENVYNLDETGLFFRMLPDRSLTTADKTKGAKKPKDRISVMLCSNADGSDKLKPLIIGKAQNPRCFKNFSPDLYCDYYANKKACMVNGILQEFLKSFDRRMARENRKVLLLMDNAPSHIIPEKLTHVRCEFLPPTTTSHLQPMDAGIINAYKAHYRRYLVRFHVDAIDAGRPPKVEVSDAIRWTKLSWDEITADSIKSCWRHTGILPKQLDPASVAVNTAVPPPSLYRDFGNIFDRLNIPTELLMTPSEYVDVDRELQTCALMTDSEIVQAVSTQQGAGSAGSTVSSDDDDDGDEADPPRVTNGEAAGAIDAVMRFFEQSGLATADDVQHLSFIKRRVDYLRVTLQKQSSILDFYARARP